MISLSLKELLIFWKQSNKLLATAKTFLKCRIVFVVFANIYLSTNMMKFFILLSNQTTSGPAISNRHRPASLSCESNLTALPTPLFCSWGWLIAIEKKRFALLLTAKFPLQNSSYISEHVSNNFSKSSTCRLRIVHNCSDLKENVFKTTCKLLSLKFLSRWTSKLKY